MLTAPTLYECEGYRLPTDAEWEYAVRASTKTAYYSSDIVPGAGGGWTCESYDPLVSIAWYCANSGNFTHPVGQKYPNAWHLFDMTGNAGEWVTTWTPGKRLRLDHCRTQAKSSHITSIGWCEAGPRPERLLSFALRLR